MAKKWRKPESLEQMATAEAEEILDKVEEELAGEEVAAISDSDWNKLEDQLAKGLVEQEEQFLRREASDKD